MKIKLYAEERLKDFLDKKKLEIKDIIESETEEYILNVGEEQYIEYLKNKFQLDVPELHTDEVYIDSYEKEILGKDCPWEYRITDPYATIKRDVIVYHVPYSGSIELLKYRPSTWSSWAGYEIQIDKQAQAIIVEVINFYNDPEKINREFNDSLKRIMSSYDNLKSEIEAYNNGLESYIRYTLNERRQHILKKRDFLSSLGVPLKKNKNTPQTFAVPKPKLRDKISIRPTVDKNGFTPEPTLDDENYQKILKLINDIGKNFERLPSTYSNKKEEDLRDHILMILDPNFEYGSASGETFNKSGKTDIQLRYDSSVVFIAECKFWRGKKAFLETIDQLLSYLTWRNSKASIIIFVRNNDFTRVLQIVKKIIKEHPNFIKELNDSDESWFNYIFSLPTDQNKEIKLAVQLYYIPTYK